MRDEGEQSNTTICEACGTAVPSYDVVSYGSIDRGYRELCTRCFNAEVASVLGLERFEHVQLQPIVMMDCAGEKHEFHFGIRLLGHVMALDAFELKAGVPGGYQFEMLGEPDGETLSLLGSLIERIRRSLSVRYLERCEDGARIVDQTVCGRIRMGCVWRRPGASARYRRSGRIVERIWAHADEFRGLAIPCGNPRSERGGVGPEGQSYDCKCQSTELADV